VTPEPTPSPSELGKALQEVTELSQKIIHEEIELAKAEVSMKVTKLAKGAAVGAAAGVFVLTGLIYFLHALSWFIWKLVRGDSGDDFFWGFLIVAVLLFVLAGLAGFLAFKFVKGGAPPTPQMAIDEAQKVRATLKKGSDA
jgi:hypothetical protein